MAGFTGTKANMLIFKAEEPANFTLESLRGRSFQRQEAEANGRRMGWTGLGDMLDSENFFLANCGSRFVGFSFRLDQKKPSGALIRLELAERIRSEERRGSPVGPKRRKELKETVTERVASQSPAIPSLTDCIWDDEKSRLLICAASEKAAQPIVEAFEASMGGKLVPFQMERTPFKVFAEIASNNGASACGYDIQQLGSATLSGMADSGAAMSVAVRNSETSVNQALSDGMIFKKINLIATLGPNPDGITFALDSKLAVSGIALPKAEKDAEEEASFLINARICSDVADIVEALFGKEQERG